MNLTVNFRTGASRGLKKQIDNRKKAIAGARAIDASKLTEEQQYERDYLISVLEGDLFWIEQVDWPHKNPAYYLNMLDPNVYIARPYASAEIRMRAFIAYANNIPAAADHIKANLQLPLPKTYLKFATTGFERLCHLLSW